MQFSVTQTDHVLQLSWQHGKGEMGKQKQREVEKK